MFDGALSIPHIGILSRNHLEIIIIKTYRARENNPLCFEHLKKMFCNLKVKQNVEGKGLYSIECHSAKDFI